MILVVLIPFRDLGEPFEWLKPISRAGPAWERKPLGEGMRLAEVQDPIPKLHPGPRVRNREPLMNLSALVLARMTLKLLRPMIRLTKVRSLLP